MASGGTYTTPVAYTGAPSWRIVEWVVDTEEQKRSGVSDMQSLPTAGRLEAGLPRAVRLQTTLLCGPTHRLGGWDVA